MKIITNKHTTTIYTEKKNGKLLKSTLKKIKELQYLDAKFEKNRFLIKYVLTQYHKTKIINAFKTDVELKESKKNIISGFKGCPISGFDFVWL